MASEQRRRPWGAGALALASALTCLTPAPLTRAQGAEPSVADKETARSLMRSGKEKFTAGDFKGALADYQNADLIMGVPTTRIAVARAQEQLGLLLEARDTALSTARIPKQAGEADSFDRARTAGSELARDLAGRVPTMKLVIRGVPEGTVVAVTVDGKPLPAALAAVPRKANPGKHEVTATAEGYAPVEVVVELAEGEVRDVPVEFGPRSTTPTEATGPAPPPAPAPAPVPTVEDEPDPPSSGGISPLVWVGFGIGGAGLLVGGITGGMAVSQASDLSDRCPDDACLRADTESDYDSTLTLAHVSTASFVVGGAGVAFGLVALVAFGGDDEPETSTVTVRPIIGPTALGVQGRF